VQVLVVVMPAAAGSGALPPAAPVVATGTSGLPVVAPAPIVTPVDPEDQPLVGAQRDARASGRADRSAERGKMLTGAPHEVAELMLQDLENPPLTDKDTNYAAVIHLILDKGQELRSRLPGPRDPLTRFTKDVTTANIIRFRRFLGTLGGNPRVVDAMKAIQDTGATRLTGTAEPPSSRSKNSLSLPCGGN
jgi:hypothetical protein